MQTDIQAVRADVEAIKGNIDAWPDLHFLQAAAQQHLNEAKEAREHRRDIEIKLDEIYGSMATSSEIKKLRKEVADSIDREKELDLRISAIEMRLGVKNPLDRPTRSAFPPGCVAHCTGWPERHPHHAATRTAASLGRRG
jgi:hypothetical protein